MSTRPLSGAQTKALLNCAQDWHRWHPTFSLGERLCTVCGALAYCPYCLTRPPSDKAKLLPCALHREREGQA